MVADATHWSRYNCRTRHARLEGAQRREARASDEVPADVGTGVAWQASRRRRPQTACGSCRMGAKGTARGWGHVVDEDVRELCGSAAVALQALLWRERGVTQFARRARAPRVRTPTRTIGAPAGAMVNDYAVRISPSWWAQEMDWNGRKQRTGIVFNRQAQPFKLEDPADQNSARTAISAVTGATAA